MEKIFKMYPKTFTLDLLKRVEKRQIRNREYETKYLNGDKSALREFCRIDLFAIHTPWIQKAIQNCLLDGEMEPLKNLFTDGKKNEKKNRFREMIENLNIKVEVDKAALETGLPKNRPDAFKAEYRDENNVYEHVWDQLILRFGTAKDMTPRSIYNRYQKEKKQHPDYMLDQITDECLILRFGPAIRSMQGKPLIGVFEVFFHIDGREPIFYATGRFNIPLGKDKNEILPQALTS